MEETNDVWKKLLGLAEVDLVALQEMVAHPVKSHWPLVALSPYAVELRYEPPNQQYEPLDREDTLCDVEAPVAHVRNIMEERPQRELDCESDA